MKKCLVIFVSLLILLEAVVVVGANERKDILALKEEVDAAILPKVSFTVPEDAYVGELQIIATSENEEDEIAYLNVLPDDILGIDSTGIRRIVNKEKAVVTIEIIPEMGKVYELATDRFCAVTWEGWLSEPSKTFVVCYCYPGSIIQLPEGKWEGYDTNQVVIQDEGKYPLRDIENDKEGMIICIPSDSK